MDISEIAGAQVLTIKPGDVVVLHCAGPLSTSQVERIQDQVKAILDCPVIVLEDTAISVVRREEVSA